MDEDDLETLGEKLYDQIYLRHKETAGKLTGMLLELPCHVLSKMLQDEVMLEGALEKALRALQLAQESSKVVSKDKDDVSVSSDSLGEQLFELVEVYNTGHSQKITGMLLEQDKEAILNLLSDPKLLEEQMNQALKMLQGIGCFPAGRTWRHMIATQTQMRQRGWEKRSSHWWRSWIHCMLMILQVCYWKWTELVSSRC
ncbi:polyadenylate-binding protein 3 isoform X2 [Thalassophryne amazonica]|uniref:polyadenylate-binding protein 3 isoform X2 n=1 Tax=Thalassophryne amazonica TaxID=390379 RepID=UPI001470E005|nr:polyadenylate-binding protein 3 isoform X2 [Thalassophryne amazonica]